MKYRLRMEGNMNTSQQKMIDAVNEMKEFIHGLTTEEIRSRISCKNFYYLNLSLRLCGFRLYRQSNGFDHLIT